MYVFGACVCVCVCGMCACLCVCGACMCVCLHVCLKRETRVRERDYFSISV